MATLLQFTQNLKNLKESQIVASIFKEIKKIEAKIIKLNKDKLTIGENVEGQIVGEYSPYTEVFADRAGIFTSKTPNSPYNFQWSGEFYKGFFVSVNGSEATISSKGIGTGDKKDFLTTNKLFGLQDADLIDVIQTDLLPFIQKEIRRTLNI